MGSKAARKRVAIDIDFTIADVGKVILRLHNQANSTNYAPEDITDWGWSSIKMTHDKFNEAYIKTWTELAHEVDLMIDSALLRRAEKYYDIDFVTNRKDGGMYESTAEPLRKWLEHHHLDDINLVLLEMHRHKAEFDYDFIIDDSPHLAIAMEMHKAKTLFLVDTPHNRSASESKNVIRVSSTNAALERLISMAEK